MAHKRKGQLTTSGEWAKHLRGFLKRQFWKGERKAERMLIENDLNSRASWTYKNYEVYGLNKQLISYLGLNEIKIDSTNWRTFYINSNSNWISFNPFSEYHGGGQSFIINIGAADFDKWIAENKGFEKEVRRIIENK